MLVLINLVTLYNEDCDWLNTSPLFLTQGHVELGKIRACLNLLAFMIWNNILWSDWLGHPV